MTNEYRIEIKVRNNILLDRVEKAGYRSVPVFCKENGIDYHCLNDVINMTRSALDSRGNWRTCVLKTANAFDCSPENLFTESQLNAQLKTNKKTLKVNEAEMRFMLEQDEPKLLEDSYAEEQRDAMIEKMLTTLTPREQKVLKMRMGLGEYDREYTLEETGNAIENHYGTGPTSRERIRQIEQKALRKLRHPLRSQEIRNLMEME
jgi:RNA polymerase sigma factor (sigma-70 family)